MATPRTDFPPIKACLFDMDGLLINTEDIYTLCHNILLSRYSSGPMTWDIKSQLQGRPAAQSIALLLSHFKLTHIPIPEYTSALHAIQESEFRKAAPLPGVPALLHQLKSATTVTKGEKVHVALATSSNAGHFEIKTDHLGELFSIFEPERRVLGDDVRIPKGRGKPSPDIYLVALKAINDSLEEGEEEIRPEECLVFEDGIPGVVAGRRAGMRVVWCPHEGLAGLWKGKEGEVLAGRGEGSEVDPEQLGEVGDGWGEQRVTLEDFPWGKYGVVPGA
ncbi:HAD-like domain-containing protein [Leptodontidium sp. 2 PMI_412]|nr:HAD-like domain-containing protein [Leptodontidium sp. 2 PMI_412]